MITVTNRDPDTNRDSKYTSNERLVPDFFKKVKFLSSLLITNRDWTKILSDQDGQIKIWENGHLLKVKNKQKKLSKYHCIKESK